MGAAAFFCFCCSSDWCLSKKGLTSIEFVSGSLIVWCLFLGTGYLGPSSGWSNCFKSFILLECNKNLAKGGESVANRSFTVDILAELLLERDY